MDLSDEELVKKIQHGEIGLFSKITERYFDKIFHYTQKMHFNNKVEAEDSTAETFYKAYRYITQTQKSSSNITRSIFRNS